MKKVLNRKFSFLGLALTVSSIITAAILPSFPGDKSLGDPNGSITGGTEDPYGSCTITDVINNPCHNTVSCIQGGLSGSTRPPDWESISNNTTLEDQ
jgi:hypothetical protein